jgi:hypothetical protein
MKQPMTLAKYQSKSGGLNDRGRKHYHVKRPVRAGTNARRVSFAARFGHTSGPERDSNGKPTRLLLALRKWGFTSKATARKFAQRHKAK